jgi:hypothetical protein
MPPADLGIVRAQLAAIEQRCVELERRGQDLDCELGACDENSGRARIAAVRMGVAFELADLHRLLRALARRCEGWDRREAAA